MKIEDFLPTGATKFALSATIVATGAVLTSHHTLPGLGVEAPFLGPFINRALIALGVALIGMAVLNALLVAHIASMKKRPLAARPPPPEKSFWEKPPEPHQPDLIQQRMLGHLAVSFQDERELAKKMGVSVELVRYHAEILERHGMLSCAFGAMGTVLSLDQAGREYLVKLGKL